MEIKVIEIKAENIKKIRKYLRKWNVRKHGATLMDIVCALNLGYNTTKETLEWMFKEGDLMITRHQWEATRYHA